MIQSLSDRQRKRKVSQRRLALVAFTVFLGLLWIFVRPVFLAIADPFVSLYVTTKTTLYSGGTRAKVFFTTKEESLRYIRELEVENSKLHNELTLLQNTGCQSLVSVSDVETLLASTTTSEIVPSTDPCKEAFIRQTQMRESVVAVSPLTAPLSGMYDTLRISKGENHLIKEGDIVYSRGRVALGKVVSTTKNTALVLLFSKDGTENYGTLKDGVSSFKVVGAGGGSYVASIPRDIEIKEGDTIVLTEDSRFSLGTVSSVVFLKQDIAKKIYIRGGFSPSSLGVLYVTVTQ